MPIQPKRLRLKGWLEGESLREQLKESKSTDEIINNLYSYLTLICGEQDWNKLDWVDVAELYYKGIEINIPSIEFPMLLTRSEDGKKLPWEYDERPWYMWANTLASKYSWSLEYIAELDIDDAIGLMQEILVDENLEKEWDWNLSELTYSYDSNTKTSKHAPYPLPQWMLPISEPPAKTKLRKDMLPMGLVIGDDSNVKH
jgi:hypothetical protein